MHGAVLRGAGSQRICERGTPGTALAVASARCSPVTTTTRSSVTSGASRRTVAARRVSSLPPASGRSCFGRSEREAGQNLVPAPPAMITA